MSYKGTLQCSKELARMQKGFISPAEASLAARKEATERYEAQQAAFREHQRQEAKKVSVVFSKSSSSKGLYILLRQ